MLVEPTKDLTVKEDHSLHQTMVTVEGKNLASVNMYVTSYLKEYAPSGYGTSSKISKIIGQDEIPFYRARIVRSRSCD